MSTLSATDRGEATPCRAGTLRPLSEDRIQVGVVIATRNRAQRLAAALESLRHQTLPAERFEVVVVDDDSTDGTPALLRAEAARGDLRLRFLRNPWSIGPGAARNLGWRSTQASLVAFTDDDCEATPEWLEAGLKAWGGSRGRFVQGRTTPIERERHRLGLHAYSYEIVEPDDTYSTLNMFYPRELLERLGGFDDDAFPTVGEDTDLGWRARAIGAEPVFAPRAEVQHAVLEIGLRGALRRAWNWSPAALLYRRHPALRRQRLLYRVFWNWQHHSTGRVLVALVLPPGRALWPLKLWLAGPWLRDRAIDPITHRPSLRRAAWYAVLDPVEMAGMARGSLAHRTLVL